MKRIAALILIPITTSVAKADNTVAVSLDPYDFGVQTSRATGENLGDKQVLHAWCRTWAARISKNGMNVGNIQKTLGRSCLETTPWYLCDTSPDDPTQRATRKQPLGTSLRLRSALGRCLP